MQWAELHCDPEAREFPRTNRGGFQLLFKARLYAQNAQRDSADFAVEIHRLFQVGMTECDLRWLICKHMVTHLHELTMPTESGRATRPTDSLAFVPTSCFALTEAGVEFVKHIFCHDCDMKEPQHRSTGDVASTTTHSQLISPPLPRWDATRRELRVGPALVKRYRVPAPIQELILSTFEEEKWADRVDDPLPPIDKIDAKQRLHTAIRSLNRNQKEHRLHFSGDGSGTGVCWQYIHVAAQMS